MPGGGSVFLVSGVRSEQSKRTMFTGVGAYPQPFTLQNYGLSSQINSRPATTGTVTAGSATVMLSTAGFTFGDSIVIAGAGMAGGDLRTKITSMANPVSAGVFPPIATSAAHAAIILDKSVSQNSLEENGGGPYVHLNNLFNPSSGTTVQGANGPQIFIGNVWMEKLSDPFASNAVSALRSATLIGNYAGGVPMNVMNQRAGQAAAAIPDGSSTVDVSGGGLFSTGNSSRTSIRVLTGGVAGDVVRIVVTDIHTSFETTGNLRFPGLNPMPALQSGVYEFVCRGVGGPWNMVISER